VNTEAHKMNLNITARFIQVNERKFTLNNYPYATSLKSICSEGETLNSLCMAGNSSLNYVCQGKDGEEATAAASASEEDGKIIYPAVDEGC